jgi:hypothetical protein
MGIAEVGIIGRELGLSSHHGRREPEEFPFRAEESAQRPGAEMSVQDPKEKRGNLV